MTFDAYHTIQDAVYDSLRKAIINRRLSVGERLVEKHLAEHFCVSRTPVRKALKRLDKEGLVTYSGRQGALVSYMNVDDLEEIFKLREVFEGLIIEAAIKNMDSPSWEAIHSSVLSSEEKFHSGDLESVKRSFENMHDLLIKTAQLPRTAMLLNEMVEYLNQFRSETVAHPNRCIEVIKEHQRIVGAIGRLDTDKAIEENKVHLHQAKTWMIAQHSRC